MPQECWERPHCPQCWTEQTTADELEATSSSKCCQNTIQLSLLFSSHRRIRPVHFTLLVLQATTKSKEAGRIYGPKTQASLARSSFTAAIHFTDPIPYELRKL